MSSKSWWAGTVVAVGAMAIGCGQTHTGTVPQASQSSAAPSAAGKEILLAEEPADAKPVADARETAEDGAEVTVLGRIGGGMNPWVEGRAAFTIVDPKLEYCQPGEGCPTPWDYCCKTDQLPGNRAMIKVVNSAGETVGEDARKLLGVKELQTVVVKGKAKRDEAGNLTVLAERVFVMPETK